jgi:hypothetical protein
LVVPGQPKAEPDAVEIAMVARARLWFAELRTGAVSSLATIAKREGIATVQVKRTLPLAFTSAQTVCAIAQGRGWEGLRNSVG